MEAPKITSDASQELEKGSLKRLVKWKEQFFMQFRKHELHIRSCLPMASSLESYIFERRIDGKYSKWRYMFNLLRKHLCIVSYYFIYSSLMFWNFLLDPKISSFYKCVLSHLVKIILNKQRTYFLGKYNWQFGFENLCSNYIAIFILLYIGDKTSKNNVRL